jgi:hypothetical protein
LVFERKKSPKIGNFYSNYVAVTATELGWKITYHRFLRKQQFFRRKSAKIASNSDRNIDPWQCDQMHISSKLTQKFTVFKSSPNI